MSELRVERWVRILAESIGCTCRGSDEVAEMIQRAVDERRERGPVRGTWLSPYYEIFYQHMRTRPSKRIIGILAKVCREAELQAIEEYGEETGQRMVQRSFARYCEEMASPGKKPFLSFPKWADTWAAYLPQVRY